VVADLGDRTVITVEDFARLVGISRSAAYEAARRGEFPVRRVGRRLFVPVPALKRWLGVDLEVPASDARSGPTLAQSARSDEIEPGDQP
jgi:excisionase family DNA binding protein